MKLLFASTLLLLFASASFAASCPWKVKSINGEIDKAVDRTTAAWRIAKKKNQEIAMIRPGVIVDCEGNNSRAKLNAFQPRIRTFDVGAEVSLAATLVACVDEKRAEARLRIKSARASGNKTLERRLLSISALIEEFAPRALDHDVSVNQLASRIEHLSAERDLLRKSCDLGDF